jgi:hypothetical protein
MNTANEATKLQKDIDELNANVKALWTQSIEFASQFGKLIGSDSGFKNIIDRMDDWPMQIRSTFKSQVSGVYDVTKRVRHIGDANDQIRRSVIKLGMEHSFFRGIFWALHATINSYLSERKEATGHLETWLDGTGIGIDHENEEFDYTI